MYRIPNPSRKKRKRRHCNILTPKYYYFSIFVRMDYKAQLKGNNGALFHKFWKSLPEKSENLVRVFVRDSLGHFTVHDSDTKFISKILNIENTVHKGQSEVNTTGMHWAMINLVQA